jgi:hypothetical protein
VVGAIAGRALAEVVAWDVAVGDAVEVGEPDADAVEEGDGLAAGEADADAIEDGDGLPATAEPDGSGGKDGTPEAVDTGVADAVAVGALPSCSVQVVPSQVQVSPITSPAADVDPRSSPPRRTTWPVPASYARAGSERGVGVLEVVASTQPVAGLVDTHVAPLESRPTTSPTEVSATGCTSK